MSELRLHYEPHRDLPDPSRQLVTDEIARLLRSRVAVTVAPNGRELHGLVIDSIHDLINIAITHDWTDVDTVEIDSTRSNWKLELRLTRDCR